MILVHPYTPAVLICFGKFIEQHFNFRNKLFVSYLCILGAVGTDTAIPTCTQFAHSSSTPKIEVACKMELLRAKQNLKKWFHKIWSTHGLISGKFTW